jgi:hypothetical protein
MDLHHDRHLCGLTARPQALPAAAPPDTTPWVLPELQFVRLEAQREADLAYQDWARCPGRDGYVIYRAAQDRADAAHDELAAWVRDTRPAREPDARCCGFPGNA